MPRKPDMQETFQTQTFLGRNLCTYMQSGKG